MISTRRSLKPKRKEVKEVDSIVCDVCHKAQENDNIRIALTLDVAVQIEGWPTGLLKDNSPTAHCVEKAHICFTCVTKMARDEIEGGIMSDILIEAISTRVSKHKHMIKMMPGVAKCFLSVDRENLKKAEEIVAKFDK